MIHVLIERHVASGLLSTYENFLRQALQKTFVTGGFISGEAFHSTNNENHRFLMCKWRSQQDWDRWYSSDERRELMSILKPLLEQDEQIQILVH